MNQFIAFISELQTRLPDNPPYLVTAYHIILVVAGLFVAWMILRALLHFVEKRISKYEFIQINTQVFKLIRRVMFLALVFVAGTYFFRLTRAPILEKIFHALLIIFLAIPAKNFLVIAIGYLQKKIAHRTESKIDDIVFELLARFSANACARFHISPTGLKLRLMSSELRFPIRNGIYTLKGRFKN